MLPSSTLHSPSFSHTYDATDVVVHFEFDSIIICCLLLARSILATLFVYLLISFIIRSITSFIRRLFLLLHFFPSSFS